MLKQFPYGEWLPDLAPRGNHLTAAVNLLPIANGYAPVKAFQQVARAIAYTGPTGGAAYIGSNGTSALLYTTASGIQRYDTTAWTSVNALNSPSRRYSTQFGDNVIWASGATPALISYNILAGTAALIAGAPTANDVATVRDFVVAVGINGDDSLIGWSEFNNSASWPMNGTGQSDSQPLLDGGKAVRIVGGEYGIILQRAAIRRLTYVGGDIVFQIDKIAEEIGCMAGGSVAAVGKLIFFLSERGFMVCDGASVTPIGEEKFNRWFFSRFSREDIQNIWAAVDPRNSVVVWAMPGTPGVILVYNYELKRASTIEMDVSAVFTGFTGAVALEALDAIYPGGLDTIPESLDSAMFQGGNPMLFVVDAGFAVGTLGGANMEASAQVRNIEPSPGKRSRIRILRPVTDATSATAVVNAKMRAGDGESTVSAASMRGNGKMPTRANGRYNDITMTIPAGQAWSFIQGVEVEFEPGDGR